jgi:2-polyprenyl-3-methyl-5-hydroxy-6-metoxy-1,4-benzoquinol methylase
MSTEKNIEQQKDFYNTYWRGMQPLGSYKIARTKWIMDALLQLRKKINDTDTRLLDLGCGDGRLVPLWQAITGAETYGLELSPETVQAAQQMFPFIRYKEGDATQTGYDNAHFDIVVCHEVLEHIEEQDKLVSECNRIIKAGGYLVLTTPNKYYFDRRKGGNYSQQPVENIIDMEELFRLLAPYFEVMSFETLIYARGDYGAYKYLTNRYWLAILRRLGMVNVWKHYLLKKGYGLHIAVVCRKKLSAL